MDFSGEISALAENYDKFRREGDGDPIKEENLSDEQHHVHNKIQRHMTKGNLIFPSEIFYDLFKGFGESNQILHSQELARMKEWSKFLLDLFEIEKLVLSLGPEINLKIMKKGPLFSFF